jgi:hypothetical protein
VLQSSSPDGKDMEDKIVKLLIRTFLKITFVIRICIFDDKREEIRKNVRDNREAVKKEDSMHGKRWMVEYFCFPS